MKIPINPSAEDFEPTLDISRRRMNVEGHRIAARIASWDNIHVGIPGAGKMPKNVNVEAAHIGLTTLDDGSDLATAVLPMHTTHASSDKDIHQAASWYEDSGKRVARVRYSLDEFGIRADGVLFPDVSDVDVTHLKAGAPSGDWRFASLLRSPEDFETHPADFAGAAIVNIAGFSDTYSNFAGRPIRLAASADGSLIFTEDTNVNTSEDGDDVSGTAGDDTKPDDCDGSCETCTCGKKDALTAAAGGEHESPDDAGGLPEKVAELSARLADLEDVVAQIVMSY